MALYIVSLCIACMMPCGALRATAVTSAALTLLYTPLFKPIVGVKTLVCATVMAASPFFGALAALVRAFPPLHPPPRLFRLIP